MFYFLYCMIQVNEQQPHTPPPILFFHLACGNGLRRGLVTPSPRIKTYPPYAEPK